MTCSPRRQSGFTLIELIIVIVITGIIGAIVAVFLRAPVDAYFGTARRAALSDAADTAMRRMARDIRKALPNSVRNPSDPSNQCIEFIPTKTGGRYRTGADAAGAGDFLDFAATDTSFNMLGLNSTLPTNQRITVTDVISVYNLGIPGSDAYTGINTSVVQSVAEGTPTLANETRVGIANRQFPQPSGSNRFHVIPGNEKIVSFVCPTATPGNLVRNANYAYPASVNAATACPTAGAILARNVTCALDYSGSDLQRNGLIRMTINVTDPTSGETVRLYHEVHMDNSP